MKVMELCASFKKFAQSLCFGLVLGVLLLAGQHDLGVNNAHAFDNVIVEVPWKIDGPLPEKGATLKCEVTDSTCKVVGKQSKTVGEKDPSGTAKFTFGGAVAKDAAGVQCDFAAEGINGSVNSKKAIPGTTSSCGGGNGQNLNLLPGANDLMQSVGDGTERLSQNPNQKVQVKTPTADPNAKPVQEQQKQTASSSNSKSDNNTEDKKDKLIKGKTKAEWEKIWKSYKDTSLAAAKKGDTTTDSLDHTRAPPEYCEKDDHCKFGHFWQLFAIGPDVWDQEWDGKCVRNMCQDNVARKAPSLDSTGSQCKRHYECDTKNHEGFCIAGTCQARERRSCTPGNPVSCVTMPSSDGDPGGKPGLAQCLSTNKLGTCVPNK